MLQSTLTLACDVSEFRSASEGTLDQAAGHMQPTTRTTRFGLFSCTQGEQGQPPALGTAAGLATDPQRSMNLRFLRDQLPRRRLPAAAPVGSPCHWLPEALYAA